MAARGPHSAARDRNSKRNCRNYSNEWWGMKTTLTISILLHNKYVDRWE